jgi:hypothetical protein
MVFNRREYVTYLYPQTSCADPVRNTPAEFVWKQHWLSVASGMKRCLGAWRGRTLTYVSHRFAKPDQTYGPLTLRRELVVTVTDEKGKRLEMRPFRDLIRLNGTYKVFSFPT